MRAGNRDRQIVIERFTPGTEDAFGGVVETWATLTTIWAQIVYGNAAERREAGREGNDQPVTFRIIANATTLAITPADRVNYDSYYYDISSVSRLGRDAVEIIATRRAD